jgi:hypothetical protein
MAVRKNGGVDESAHMIAVFFIIYLDFRPKVRGVCNGGSREDGGFVVAYVMSKKI